MLFIVKLQKQKSTITEIFRQVSIKQFEVLAMQFKNGTKIWISNHKTKSWCIGIYTQKANEGDKITVIDSDNEEYVILRSKAMIAAEDHNVPEDLLMLPDFHEGAVLDVVRKRYFKNDCIYTAIGSPILISVNPFKEIRSLYTNEKRKFYRERTIAELVNAPPHLFKIASFAYQTLFETDESQSMIISGESGAGKTEATKIILKFLASSSEEKSSEIPEVERQVLMANPLLEAFGNAKTVRNDNSSRFGKFIEVHFDREKKIKGAKIQNYLLEKSRIISQHDGERNYHIFYQILSSKSIPKDIYLLDISEYNYLEEGSRTLLKSDSRNFDETMECMESLNFPEKERIEILKIVAGVMLMGNLEFGKVVQEKKEVILAKNANVINPVCDMLGINLDALNMLCCYTCRMNPQTKKRDLITNVSDKNTASYNRDALVKTIYSTLFDYLIARINEIIYPHEDEENSKMPKNKKKNIKDSPKMIGLLDIFGFEIFDVNSFEQLCINYANEKLQQHYNKHMFKQEQIEYGNEEIEWKKIEFIDNKITIDLLDDYPKSIFYTLDEVCKWDKTTDETFLGNLKTKFGEQKDGSFGHPKFVSLKNNRQFGVKHYAGDVVYDVAFFCDKNKHQINYEVYQILMKSTNTIIKKMFTVSKEEDTKKKETICVQFRSQMHSLVDTLNRTNPYYIRCIKPNKDKLSDTLESDMVLKQLICAGILESIRIRKAGFSVRRTHNEFVNRYKVILPKYKSKLVGISLKQQSQLIIEYFIKTKEYLKIFPEKKGCDVGKTKVFLKDEAKSLLDFFVSNAVEKYILKMQALGRGFLAREKVRRIKREKISREFLNQLLKQAAENSVKQTAARRILRWLMRIFKKEFYKEPVKTEADYDDGDLGGNLLNSVVQFEQNLIQDTFKEEEADLAAKNQALVESKIYLQKLEEQKELYNKLNDLVSFTKQESHVISGELSSKKKMINNLRKTIHELEKENGELKKERRDLKALLLKREEIILAQKSNADQIFRDLSQKIKNSQYENSQLKNILQGMSTSLPQGDIQGYMEEIAKNMGAKNEKINELKRVNADTLQSLKQEKKNVVLLEKDNERLDQEKKTLSKQLNAAQSELTNYKALVKELNDKVKSLESEVIDSVGNSINTLEPEKMIKIRSYLGMKTDEIMDLKNLVLNMSQLLKYVRIQNKHLTNVANGYQVSKEQSEAYQKIQNADNNLSVKVHCMLEKINSDE